MCFNANQVGDMNIFIFCSSRVTDLVLLSLQLGLEAQLLLPPTGHREQLVRWNFVVVQQSSNKVTELFLKP